MNTAIVQGCRAPKRPPSSSAVNATLHRDVQTKIFFSDDLRALWEQIAAKGCS